MGHDLTKKVVAGAVAALAAGAMQTANADIELGEGFSVTGFVDQSFSSTKYDGSSASKSFGIDQVETDFLYTGSDGVTARVDIEYGESTSDLVSGDNAAGSGPDTTFVEQAYVTKAFNEQFSMKLGRFLSYSGWETEEPTGLFQYSGTGYAKYFYGYYQQGLSAYYKGGKFDVMASVVNDVFGYADGAVERDTKKPGYEVGVAVMPIEGLTAKAFYMSDDKTDRDVINVWASYAFDGFTFAGEYNDGDFGPNGKGTGFLVMGNYATGPWGVTLRYHQYKIEDDAGVTTDKDSVITVSPSYKVGKNLLLVAEYRMDNYPGSTDSKAFALEALFTF